MNGKNATEVRQPIFLAKKFKKAKGIIKSSGWTSATAKPETKR